MQAIPGAWVCDPAGPGLLPQPTHPPQPRYPIAYRIYLIHTQETEHTAQYRQGGVIQNFLAIFENEHYAAYQVYFYKSNSRKSTIFATHARQSFHFQKSQTLKNIFFLNIFQYHHSPSKNKCQKEIWNLLWFNILQASKMSKIGFVHPWGEGKN